MYIRAPIPNKGINTHETDTFAEGGRKCVEDIYGWGEPL